MNASKPCLTGANAAAAGLFDNGMTEPILITSSIGAVAASGSAHSSVLTVHPDAPADFAALFNPVVADVPAGVRLAAHLCFGNFMGRPLAKRTYRPVLDQLRRFAVHELVLEFANREISALL